jgi:ATP-binding cassette, subfamily C (CFTR/MRP), member 1
MPNLLTKKLAIILAGGKDGEYHLSHTSLSFISLCRTMTVFKRSEPPPPGKVEDAPVIPLHNASIFSILTYSWLSPLISLGYRRPLEVGDLWKMDPSRESGHLSRLLDIAWSQEQDRMTHIRRDLIEGRSKPPFLYRLTWRIKATFDCQYETLTADWQKRQEEKSPSLVRALFSVFGRKFLLAGLFKVVSDTSQITTPILVKVSSSSSIRKKN